MCRDTWQVAPPLRGGVTMPPEAIAAMGAGGKPVAETDVQFTWRIRGIPD